MIKFMAVIAAIAILPAGAGCGPKPNYSYNAGNADPVLVFTSDFTSYIGTYSDLSGATSFSVNIDPSNKISDNNSVKKFMLAGHLYDSYSYLLSPAGNREASI
jgi:hypothetical protein